MNKSSRFQWKLILVPFSWLYGLVVWIRNSSYDQGLFKSTGFNMPLISVGNITVGGTGKTPHTEYLVRLLKKDFRLATLSRGYRRKTRDFRIATPDSKVQDIGDEPLQIKKKFPDITVAVDRERVHGITELMKLVPTLEAILLDDAYQHRSLRPGYSILLIDYKRPILNDRLLPAGMLREPADNRNRANIILVTKTPEDIKPMEMREFANNLDLNIGQHLFFTTMRYGELAPLFPRKPGDAKDAEWYRAKGGGILLVSGIANPQGLRAYAETISDHIVELKYPDHHHYTLKDIERIMQLTMELAGANGEVLILTTEKDAVKLCELDFPENVRSFMHAVPIEVHFLNDDKENFDKQIYNYVTSNKRGSVLHQGED
ncbi:MAG: tetraacyldisaccharide 4'-kinase [Bacteroidetes bacterium]|nr:tetraacyldisaccharide 4'-kinase [Bacteroidota bacterium]